MCDEYDDERMRAFWRYLAMQEEHPALEPESEAAVEPIVLPVVEGTAPQRSKPRALVH